MAIECKLNAIMKNQKITSKELSRRVGLTDVNISNYRTGRSRAIRMSTLDAFCKALRCQPGDLFVYVPDDGAPETSATNQDTSWPPILECDIGELVKRLRSESGLTKKAFAKECGVEVSTINKLESGSPDMSLGDLNKIASRMGKHLEYRLAVRVV